MEPPYPYPDVATAYYPNMDSSSSYMTTHAPSDRGFLIRKLGCAVNKRQEGCTLMGGNQISLSLFQRILSFHPETVVLLDCFLAYYCHII